MKATANQMQKQSIIFAKYFVKYDFYELNFVPLQLVSFSIEQRYGKSRLHIQGSRL